MNNFLVFYTMSLEGHGRLSRLIGLKLTDCSKLWCVDDIGLFVFCYQGVNCMGKIFYKLFIIYVTKNKLVEFPFSKCLFLCYSAHWQHWQWCLACFHVVAANVTQVRHGVASRSGKMDTWVAISWQLPGLYWIIIVRHTDSFRLTLPYLYISQSIVTYTKAWSVPISFIIVKYL
jgi:hypothetical protein